MPFLTERPLSPREFLDECLAFKKARPIESRFLTTFLAGQLTPAQLRLWANDMYHYTQTAIPALTAWIAQAPTLIEPESARFIGRNLAGEMGFLREADHRDLYLKFLAALNVDEREAKDHLPLASTIGAAAVLGYFCRSSFEEGLGAFGLAFELQVPGRPNGAGAITMALWRYGVRARCRGRRPGAPGRGSGRRGGRRVRDVPGRWRSRRRSGGGPRFRTTGRLPGGAALSPGRRARTRPRAGGRAPRDPQPPC